MLARTYGLPTRRALYDFIPDPQDLAEHEEEYQLYRWGPELEKYAAAQIAEAVYESAGGSPRPLESSLLCFHDGRNDKQERLEESQEALRRAARSKSGWLTASAPSKRT